MCESALPTTTFRTRKSRSAILALIHWRKSRFQLLFLDFTL